MNLSRGKALDNWGRRLKIPRVPCRSGGRGVGPPLSIRSQLSSAPTWLGPQTWPSLRHVKAGSLCFWSISEHGQIPLGFFSNLPCYEAANVALLGFTPQRPSVFFKLLCYEQRGFWVSCVTWSWYWRHIFIHKTTYISFPNEVLVTKDFFLV